MVGTIENKQCPFFLRKLVPGPPDCAWGMPTNFTYGGLPDEYYIDVQLVQLGLSSSNTEVLR